MRFKLIRQKDAMQCGVASLCMACNAMGLKCTTDWNEKWCHATNQGVSLKGITDAAAEIGLDAYGVKLDIDKLSECPLPMILHWNQNHFVVLYHIDMKGQRFWIADPAKGKYKVAREELAKHWTSNYNDNGIAILFEANSRFGEIQDPNTTHHHSFSLLWSYLSQHRKSFLQIIFALIIGCILQLTLPFLTQWIVDKGIAHRNIKLIWLILLGEFLIVVGRTSADFIRRWILLHISMRINISLVSDFFIKLLKLPMSFFDTKLMGDLLQRIADHSRVQSFLTGQMLGIMFSILSFFVFGIVLCIYSKLIFFVFLAGSIVYGLWIVRFLSQRKILDYEIFEQQAINQNRTYQFVTSMQEIKLQGCEERRRCEWEDTQADLFCVQMKTLKLQQTQEAGCIFINEIKNILITVLSATAVINGNLSIGGMMAIQYIVGQLNSPVEQLMQFVYSLQDVRISLDRIGQIHEMDNEESCTRTQKQFASEKSIKINHLDFKYDPHAPSFTLKDICLDIRAGEVTAIVGASGSGKSTLMKLILGYYSVKDGQIAVAGKDINDYNLKWWRSRCGVVMQEGVIFSESIERNIAVGDSHVDFKKLEEAAKTAGINDFVMSLPLKYQTKIGKDGLGLSQGQKQRILIARAVYKSPEFIFLDEATNSLDAKNEREIVERLDEYYRGRTVLLIAHRLSTVRNAAQIVVLDSGQVAEIGTHDELISKKGMYYNLVKNQLDLDA